MSSVKLELSTRLKSLFDKGKLDEKFKKENAKLGEYILGRHTENKNSPSAPIIRSFGPWASRSPKTGKIYAKKGNEKVQGYKPYVDWYAERKKSEGQRHWLVGSTGALKYDAINGAIITSERDHVKLTMREGGSKAYQKAQQYGKPREYGKITAYGKIEIPARPFYSLDESDMRKIRDFYYKHLVKAFNGTEVLLGS